MRTPHPLSQGGADAPLLADERPRVLHSQHYNSALVRSLLETDRVDARGIVENAAAELAFASLRDAERGPSHTAAIAANAIDAATSPACHIALENRTNEPMKTHSSCGAA